MKPSIVPAVCCCAWLFIPLHPAFAQTTAEPTAQPEALAPPASPTVPAITPPPAAQPPGGHSGQLLAEERLRPEIQPRPTGIVARRDAAQGQIAAGKWLLGFGLFHFIAGTAVAMPDFVHLAQGCPPDGRCFYDIGPIFIGIGSPFMITGAILAVIGGALYGHGQATLKALSRQSGTLPPAPPPPISLQPVLSSDLYGLSLTGKF